MTGSPVRRITMETGQGFGVSWADVLAWAGSALHLGHCDYSDNDDTTGGFDIDEPLDLLAWLITDRFGQDNDALGEYAARVGIDVADWQALTLLLLADRCQGVGAWGRVRALLEQAGATTTTVDRGYV